MLRRMNYPTSPEQARRLQILEAIEALRRAVEAGADVDLVEEPMRGVSPSSAGEDFRRTVTFTVTARLYDGAFPLPG